MFVCMDCICSRILAYGQTTLIVPLRRFPRGLTLAWIWVTIEGFILDWDVIPIDIRYYIMVSYWCTNMFHSIAFIFINSLFWKRRILASTLYVLWESVYSPPPLHCAERGCSSPPRVAIKRDRCHCTLDVTPSQGIHHMKYKLFRAWSGCYQDLRYLSIPDQDRLILIKPAYDRVWSILIRIWSRSALGDRTWLSQ